MKSMGYFTAYAYTRLSRACAFYAKSTDCALRFALLLRYALCFRAARNEKAVSWRMCNI
jgi:hypothetical protein